MRKEIDPLYSVFEQHLLTAFVDDESVIDFLDRVVVDYVGRLFASGTTIPQKFRETMESDLRDEVLEMLRKKTYGHYNLASYRESRGVELSAPLIDAVPHGNEKARRLGRA